MLKIIQTTVSEAPLSHKTLLSLVYCHKRSCSYSDTGMENEFKFNTMFLTATSRQMVWLLKCSN